MDLTYPDEHSQLRMMVVNLELSQLVPLGHEPELLLDSRDPNVRERRFIVLVHYNY